MFIRKSLVTLVMLLIPLSALSEETKQDKSFPQVKEVVVFKNGFAYVRCEGETLPIDGKIIIGEIPDASLGAFWGASLTEDISLKSIKAQEFETPQEETITRIEDLIKNNTGQKVVFVTADKQELKGTLIGFQYYQPPAEKLEQLNPNEFYRRNGYYPSYSPPMPPTPQIEWVTLKTDAGIVAVKVNEIKTISIEGEKTKVTKTTISKSRRLVLTFDADIKKLQKNVKYTLFFIIKGIRWIPDYKLELAKDDKANLKLSATILNEALDIKDANVRLMIGYPRFAFGESLTPLTLREARRALSAYFSPPTPGQPGFDYLSNIAVQSAESGMRRGFREDSLPTETPQADEGSPVEDLFGYDLKNISLEKGTVLLVPITESQNPVEHLYELDTWSFQPFLRKGNIPQEIMQRIGMPDWEKVWHKLLIKNPADAPLTTAPATIFEKGQPLAQELIKYTPPKGETVMPMTIAVDILSTLNETEISRQHNALRAMDRDWDLIITKGQISLTNKKKAPVSLVVKRHLLGKVTEVSTEGKSEASPQGWDEFIRKLWEGNRRDYYWNWWNYYGYYPTVNPISFVKWEISLKPAEQVTLEYNYSYYEYR